MRKLFILLGAVCALTLQAVAADTMTFKTVHGKDITVNGTENGLTIPAYKNKIVFLEFWGTHCPPCLISIPHYIDLQAKYKDDLAILAIEVQDTPNAKLKDFAQRRGMNYDVATYRGARSLVNYVAQRASWRGSIPFLMILDQQGNVVTTQPGLIPQSTLEKVIEDLIKKNKGK